MFKCPKTAMLFEVHPLGDNIASSLPFFNKLCL